MVVGPEHRQDRRSHLPAAGLLGPHPAPLALRAPASGSGGWETHGRRYSRDDLLTLVLVRTLLEAGVRLERVREILPTLPDQWTGEPGGFVVVPPFGRAIYATDAAELAATIDTGVPAVIVVGLAPIRRTLTDNLTAPAGVGLPDPEPALTAG